ncbi:uncharacterized protein LOC132047477 [Lycium ferocissimum]|uniref:uncharacterized protein LOC132047477 n=1 Tax=Lycium ferocissimum TaxID=112874 RepID=UPI00281513FF|nr:uncharacterized protein LOC132047477 [Lycium ferocissimum]
MATPYAVAGPQLGCEDGEPIGGRTHTPIHVYMEWYMRITRIIIGNPSRRRPDGMGYVALVGAYEVLVRTVQTMRYESTARTEAPEMAEYAARMIELAETGMRQHMTLSERPIQETTSYSPPRPSQEPTDPSQEPTQAPVDTQVHPSAPEVATPDEEEVEIQT